jgi:segregation and condensation protein B
VGRFIQACAVRRSRDTSGRGAGLFAQPRSAGQQRRPSRTAGPAAADPSSHSGPDAGAYARPHASADTRPDPAAHTGADSAADPGADSAADPGADSAADPGADPSAAYSDPTALTAADALGRAPETGRPGPCSQMAA